MNKRIISVLLVVCFCMAVLAGCRGSGGVTDPATEDRNLAEITRSTITVDYSYGETLYEDEYVSLEFHKLETENGLFKLGIDVYNESGGPFFAQFDNILLDASIEIPEMYVRLDSGECMVEAIRNYVFDMEDGIDNNVSVVSFNFNMIDAAKVNSNYQYNSDAVLYVQPFVINLPSAASGNQGESEDVVEPIESTNIEWSEFSYTLSDQQGYTFEVTYKVSPWILLSNTELINSAWSEVGGNKELPTTYGSWGLEGFAHDQYVRQFQLGTEARAGDSTFGCAMTDMYYCMGTVEIKNVTEGWSIGANQPYSPSFFLPCLIDRDDNALNTAFSIGRIFFTESYRDYANNVCISARMTQDNWGPATFVIMAPEYFSPKYPSGVYLESMQNGFLITSPQQGAFWYADASDYEGEDRLYLGVYGKNGTYTPPIGAE